MHCKFLTAHDYTAVGNKTTVSNGKVAFMFSFFTENKFID